MYYQMIHLDASKVPFGTHFQKSVDGVIHPRCHERRWPETAVPRRVAVSRCRVVKADVESHQVVDISRSKVPQILEPEVRVVP